MVDNKTDAGLLCYPTQNEAESNTYYFDFDRLKSSDRYDNILFEITLAMKKLQSIGLSNDEKQRIFEAFIVTWSSYVETCLVIVAGIFMPVRFILYGRFRTPM